MYKSVANALEVEGENVNEESLLGFYRRHVMETLLPFWFRTFSNTDKKAGEWIQIRDRKGDPVDQIAALPVKDPCHIL
mgnify:CR=1 FL=1